MLPVLFSIGSITISSFGVFLALGFILGVFLIWRLARAWDLDEEKILDLTLLTFLGGLIGARIYFGLTHPSFFISNPLRILLFNKYPGFSFWGAFLGGWLGLTFFAKRFKWDFWQMADIAAVGFLGGLILADLGCFLGSCGVGAITKSFLGVQMVGLIGQRWPVQAIEALAFLIVLLNLWSKATHFHQRGKIVSLTLIWIGLIKLSLQFLRPSNLEGYVFSATLLVLGITCFYKVTGRNILRDLKSLVKFLLNRKLVLETLQKYWYNQKIKLAWRFRNFKKILRRFNVRFSLKNN